MISLDAPAGEEKSVADIKNLRGDSLGGDIQPFKALKEGRGGQQVAVLDSIS